MFQEYSSLELLLEGILPAKFLLKTAAFMDVRLSLRSRESEASNLRASTRSVKLICHGTDVHGSRRNDGDVGQRLRRHTSQSVAQAHHRELSSRASPLSGPLSRDPRSSSG